LAVYYFTVRKANLGREKKKKTKKKKGGEGGVKDAEPREFSLLAVEVPVPGRGGGKKGKKERGKGESGCAILDRNCLSMGGRRKEGGGGGRGVKGEKLKKKKKRRLDCGKDS